MINARAETVAEKPAYRRAFAKKRCIIPADGFYEWKAGPKPSGGGRPVKQPYFIHRLDGEPLAFAGLWETWKVPEDGDPELGGDDGWLRSCAIVTGPPNELMVPIHDRMPVVLPESTWEQWLDPDNHDVETLAQLLVPAPAAWFEAYAVSTSVNSARNNSAELVQPIDA
jgi:putative SOS response-associated peptidase YedK